MSDKRGGRGSRSSSNVSRLVQDVRKNVKFKALASYSI